MQNNNKNTYKTPKTVTLHPFLLNFSYLCTLEEYKSGFCETQVRFSKAAFPQSAPHFLRVATTCFLKKCGVGMLCLFRS